MSVFACLNWVLLIALPECVQTARKSFRREQVQEQFVGGKKGLPVKLIHKCNSHMSKTKKIIGQEKKLFKEGMRDLGKMPPHKDYKGNRSLS